MIHKKMERREKNCIRKEYESENYTILVRDKRTSANNHIAFLRIEVVCHGTNPDIIYPVLKFSSVKKKFLVYPVSGVFIDEITYIPFMKGMEEGYRFAKEANQMIDELMDSHFLKE